MLKPLKTVSQGQLISRGLMLGGEDSDGVYDSDKRDSVERFLLENSKPVEASPIESNKPMGNET